MTIARPALDDIVAHAREAAPNECCGVMIGRGESILTAVRARNLEQSPTRYLLDPQDHFAARRLARVGNLDVIGFYHSHPHSAALPSGSDILEASYPDAVYLIIGKNEEARIFRLAGDGATELALTVTEECDPRIPRCDKS